MIVNILNIILKFMCIHWHYCN